MQKKIAPFKMLICIVDKTKETLALQILRNAHENLGISNIVLGVSKLGAIDLMGLARNERTMITTLVRADKATRTLQALDLLLCPDDTESFGLAFIVPMNSASRDTLDYFTPKKEG